MAAAIFVAGLIALLLYLRDRTQRLYLWLAIYLLAEDGLVGFRRLDAIAFGLHSYGSSCTSSSSIRFRTSHCGCCC
jgi:hypothetical protein